MMSCITRVRPVPQVLKPMVMILRREPEWLIGMVSSCRAVFCRLTRCEEQSQPFDRAGRPAVSAPGDSEPGSAEALDQHIDGEFLDACKRENRCSRRAILAD